MAFLGMKKALVLDPEQQSALILVPRFLFLYCHKLIPHRRKSRPHHRTASRDHCKSRPHNCKSGLTVIEERNFSNKFGNFYMIKFTINVLI